MSNTLHPTIGRSREIDELALRRVLACLPAAWLPRKQEPDVHLDYIVEIVETGEPTGRFFGLQIKGCERFKSSTSLPFSFKTKHLRYYVRQCKFPVFLALVDVSTGNALWLFAQKHIREIVRGDSLHRQKYVSLKFPPENDLQKFPEFVVALEQAERYMRDLHPGSVQAALARMREDLEAKDPRLKVEISVLGGIQHIHVTPKAPLPLRLRLSGGESEKLRQHFRDCIDHGTETRIRIDKAQMTGSPLFETLLKDAGPGELRLKFGSEHPSHVELTIEGGNGPSFFHIDGVCREGRKFLNFIGQWRNSPLEIIMEVDTDATEPTVNMGFELSLNAWMGQPVLGLEYFDKFEELVSALNGAKVISLRQFIRGQFAGSVSKSFENHAIPSNVEHMFAWIGKLRFVCRHFQLNPKMPDLEKIGDEHWFNVVDLYDLLQGREICHEVPNIELAFSVDKHIDQTAFGIQNGTLLVPKRQLQFDILGTDIPVGPLHYTLIGVDLVSVKHTPKGSDVEMKGTQQCQRRLRLASPDGQPEVARFASAGSACRTLPPEPVK